MCGLKVTHAGCLAASIAAWVFTLQGCDSHVAECEQMEPAIRDLASCEAACLASDIRPNSSFYEWLGSQGSGKCRCANTVSENDTGFYKLCQDASYTKDSNVAECEQLEPPIWDVARCEAACLASDIGPNTSFYEWRGSHGRGICRCLNSGFENHIYKLCEDAYYSR